MPTNIFDTSLTSAALRAGILTIDVADLNQNIEARLSFLDQYVGELLSGLSQPVVSEGKMVDVSGYADAMVKLSEHAFNPTDANRSVVELNFPLWKFGRATGWTYDFLRLATVEDFRKSVLDTEHAYLTALQEEIKAAMFNNVRREFDDKFGASQRVNLVGRPFWNADGMTIPPAPNGATFTAATHTHYNGTSGSTLSVFDIDERLINNVIEHGNMAGIALFIPASMVTTLDALDDKFHLATRPNVIYGDQSNRSAFEDNLDSDPENKLVGDWNGYPVFSRSWCPANYIACAATGAREKPLGVRRDGGLRPIVEGKNSVLTAQQWLSYFGMAANNRGAAAFLYTAAQTTYTAPTLVL